MTSTSFPEKWYIKRDGSNYQAINEWFNQNTTYGKHYKSDFSHVYFPKFDGATTHKANEMGYVLITFEQFQQYVLKTGINYQIY